MTLTDTHTHLYLDEFAVDGGGEAAVRRALAAGVSRMVMPNVDLATIEPMEQLAAQFPGTVFMAMGLHPTEVGADWAAGVDAVESRILAAPERYVAIGEVGIDLYWDDTFRREQMDAFERQARLADRLGKPIIIHCREGLAEALEVLEAVPGARAVFHSFGGTEADVGTIRRHGDHYFGINGIVTFKNSDLRHTLPAIGIDRILLETDSPYLAPVPRRGRRNESALLPYIAAHIADALSLTAGQVAAVTSASATTFFHLPPTPQEAVAVPDGHLRD